MKFSFRKAMGIMMSALAVSCFTACEEDNELDGVEDFGGKYDLSELVAVANNDGTITIQGVVKSATKLKDFKLVSTTKEKTEFDIKGEATPVKDAESEWKWTTPVECANVPVDIYKFSMDSRFSTTKETIIGAAYEFIAGNSRSEQGSFLSFSQKCNYTLDLAKDPENAKNIEAVLNDDLTIIPASQMKNTTVKENAADSKVFDACVITSNECIATYKVEKIDGQENDLKISGIRIMSSEVLKIDVSACGFKK